MCPLCFPHTPMPLVCCINQWPLTLSNIMMTKTNTPLYNDVQPMHHPVDTFPALLRFPP